jgi:hypothetical protein
LLLLSPALIDLLQHQQVVSTLKARPDFNNVTAGEPMHPIFSFACMAIGVSMVGIATYMPVRLPSRSDAPAATSSSSMQSTAS